jgi:hypothetical protein
MSGLENVSDKHLKHWIFKFSDMIMKYVQQITKEIPGCGP